MCDFQGASFSCQNPSPLDLELLFVKVKDDTELNSFSRWFGSIAPTSLKHAERASLASGSDSTAHRDRSVLTKAVTPPPP
eukprot:2048821-Ditylum_brightwellii.AAC.1